MDSDSQSIGTPPSLNRRRSVSLGPVPFRYGASPFRWGAVLRLFGMVTIGVALSEAVALGIGIVGHDSGSRALAEGCLLAGTVGTLLLIIFRSAGDELKSREALFLVALIWLGAGFFGALPFYFSPYFPSLTDAVFECVSGFTTTGASILSDVEALPPSLHFWRAFTHWIGGLGIAVLMVAVLPFLGSGGIALYRYEFSGASSEKLKPRLAQTAFTFWKIYTAMTIVGFIALMVLGMGPIDAICHTFGAIGTGGFSTRGISVEAFNSVGVEIVLILLMVAGGINFTRHALALAGRSFRSYLEDTETRYYFAFLFGATLLISLNLVTEVPVHPLQGLRQAAFQVVSIMTATGFSSCNFDVWPPFSKALLVALMFIGGCTGSTAGGLKVLRISLLFKTINQQLQQMVAPRKPRPIRLNGVAVDNWVVRGMIVTVFLGVVVNLVATGLVCLTGPDIVTSFSGVTATMFNVGPGLAGVGPYSNYGHLTLFAKWVLITVMIAGRLEFFGFLVVFTPVFWRR